MKTKTILLVEDDFLNRRLAKKILLVSNYLVLEAKNANEALDLIKKESIDLIILDINLGENEQDGIEFGKQIKEKFNLPFIYLTAYESAEIVSKAVVTNPLSYLTKPYKNIDLIASVELALRQSEHIQKHKPFIVVKDDDYIVELPLEEINYIESDGNYLLFCTDKKSYKLRSTIKQMIEDLPRNFFIQVHRAYIVNKFKIEKYNTKSLIVNNVEIPISKSFFNQINEDKIV